MIITKSFHNQELRKNRFCGPSVISSITGLSSECAASWVKHVCGKKIVKGMYNHEMKKTLDSLSVDYSFKNIEFTKESETFFKWSKKADLSKTYLLVVGYHYVVVSGGFVYDNQYGKVLIKETKHKKKKVKTIFQIIRQKRYSKDFFPKISLKNKIEDKKKKQEENRKRYILKYLLEKTSSKIESGRFSVGREIEFGNGWSYNGIHFREVYSLDEAIEVLGCVEKCGENCCCLA
jgi:hypothetical protein